MCSRAHKTTAEKVLARDGPGSIPLIGETGDENRRLQNAGSWNSIAVSNAGQKDAVLGRDPWTVLINKYVAVRFAKSRLPLFSSSRRDRIFLGGELEIKRFLFQLRAFCETYAAGTAPLRFRIIAIPLLEFHSND